MVRTIDSGVGLATSSLTIDDRRIRLQIWNTAGQEQYRSTMAAACYNGAAGALLVYDITRRDTFTHLTWWLHDVRQHTDTSLVITLVGNKADLDEGHRQVSTEEGLRFAHENGLRLIEVSAKTATNVEDAFIQTVIRICEQPNVYNVYGPLRRELHDEVVEHDTCCCN